MKQVYIKPQIKVLCLEENTIMMSGSVGLGMDETPSIPDARGRRGKWGNLWYESDVVPE